MRKILLGISVLATLAFLAACGSGSSGSAGSDGTSGTSGTSGTDGADGADGTIAVPSADSDLAIAAVVATNDGTADSVDTTMTLGTVVRNFNLQGADKSAIDGRLRYYIYEGTSATAKSDKWDGALAFTNTDTLYTAATSVTSGILDTRGKTVGDNHTITTAGVLNTTDGTITHMIICPGNEAGDATSCASVALQDRGPSAVAYVSDNVTELGISYALSTGFGVLKSNADASQLQVELITAVKGALTYGPTGNEGTGSTTIPAGLSGVAGEVANGYNGFDMTSSGGTAAHVISAAVGDPDNYTITQITSSGTTSLSIDNYSIAAGSGAIRISEGADGIYWSVLHNDNVTISAYFNADISSNTSTNFGTDNITFVNDTGGAPKATTASHCSAAHPSGGTLVTAVTLDNGSLMTNNVLRGSAWGGNVILTDNNSTAALGQAPLGNAHASVGACDMAFNSLGEVFLVASSDNGTGVMTYKSSDNGSAWTRIQHRADAGAALRDISVAIDNQLNLPVVATNAVGSLVALFKLDNSTGTDTWVTLISETATALNAAGRVSVAALSDGTAFMVSSQGVSTGADNATVQVFWDE